MPVSVNAQVTDNSSDPMGEKLFVSGQDGYHTYRIPSVVVTMKGTILAACEGRKDSRSDSGDIDLLVKRSGDNGKTWKLGGSTPEHMVNECEAVELTGGRIMLNMRNYDPSMRYRQTSVSHDGGISWHEQQFDTILIEPICQAAIERFSWPEDYRQNVILFSNPYEAIVFAQLPLKSMNNESKPSRLVV